ncbi:hypothetical protein ERX27_01840 [Macrococcus brunensis]|uniref:Uncharacterized protein n=1 Tax=Macrococcus brunensis TaxID=198483 RepID=A0A4R6BFI2_9STAP|nr:hypothetical protein [Macrococcus brunensis]TDL98538.1 hypothetical protein ERX27_01840 [Macrococcus brunensis]
MDDYHRWITLIFLLPTTALLWYIASQSGLFDPVDYNLSEKEYAYQRAMAFFNVGLFVLVFMFFNFLFSIGKEIRLFYSRGKSPKLYLLAVARSFILALIFLFVMKHYEQNVPSVMVLNPENGTE